MKTEISLENLHTFGNFTTSFWVVNVLAFPKELSHLCLVKTQLWDADKVMLRGKFIAQYVLDKKFSSKLPKIFLSETYNRITEQTKQKKESHNYKSRSNEFEKIKIA